MTPSLAAELEERREAILEALDEFKQLLEDNGMDGAVMRLDAYAYAHIRIACGGEHGYLGSSMYSLTDAINEVREAIEQSEGE